MAAGARDHLTPHSRVKQLRRGSWLRSSQQHRRDGPRNRGPEHELELIHREPAGELLAGSMPVRIPCNFNLINSSPASQTPPGLITPCRCRTIRRVDQGQFCQHDVHIVRTDCPAQSYSAHAPVARPCLRRGLLTATQLCASQQARQAGGPQPQGGSATAGRRPGGGRAAARPRPARKRPAPSFPSPALFGASVVEPTPPETRATR